jgi:hypothetical protein
VIAAALLALAVAAPPCGPPPIAPGPPPWATGESASYDLSLFGLMKAGTIDLAVERPMPGGKVIPLRARARTDASVSNMLSLTAVGFSWVDARTLLPERYREEAEEDGVHKVSDTRLTPPGPAIEMAFQIGGRGSTAQFPRQGAVLDAISAVYALRAAKLSPGDRLCFDLLARGRVWRVSGTVAAKLEKLDTVVGKLETVRIDARASLADRPQDPERQMHVWLSTDARRLFVAAVGDIDLGPVRVTLTELRGARK